MKMKMRYASIIIVMMWNVRSGYAMEEGNSLVALITPRHQPIRRSIENDNRMPSKPCLVPNTYDLKNSINENSSPMWQGNSITPVMSDASSGFRTPYGTGLTPLGSPTMLCGRKTIIKVTSINELVTKRCALHTAQLVWDKTDIETIPNILPHASHDAGGDDNEEEVLGEIVWMTKHPEKETVIMHCDILTCSQAEGKQMQDEAKEKLFRFAQEISIALGYNFKK